MHKDRKKVLLVGGGSGGHVVPVFELYKRLEKDGLNLMVVGGGGEIETYFYTGLPEYHKIIAGKMHRVFTWKNILESVKFVVGIIQAFGILLFFRPDLIFSKGGFVSLPIIFWARIFRIPFFTHESDIEIGMTNSYAAKGALKVFTGFPLQYYPKSMHSKMIYTGQLVNADFDTKQKFDFGLDKTKKTLLFLGGSQGSQNINKAVFSLPKQAFSSFNIIHQSGEQGIDKALDLASDNPSYHPYSFLKLKNGQDMVKSAIFESDLVITRAGATTIAEVSALGRPMIVIPYKHASADHQRKNTKMLTENDAVVAISDDDLSGQALFEKIESILADKKKMTLLVENCRKSVKIDGLEIVEKEIIKRLGAI